ncbi:MAG: AAA family ATPase, partial [Planctomycetota bacterium]
FRTARGTQEAVKSSVVVLVMIDTLDVKGFKSVRDIHLVCARINLFIGEPNSGKSNILEALGFLSHCAHDGHLREFVRLQQAQNLFYDGLVEEGLWQFTVTGEANIDLTGKYEGKDYVFETPAHRPVLRLRHDGVSRTLNRQQEFAFLKFYRYKRSADMNSDDLGGLLPPDGRNMVALLFSSRELRQLAADYFQPFGLQLVIKPHEHKLEVQKQSEGIIVSFPYRLASETLQRMVFYSVAIESNRESTLVFEEPEAHAFPYYTKQFGERIALDENENQFFVATHNPYLLTAVVEKAPADDVAVFVTYYRDYETRVKRLSEGQLGELLEQDPFMGIEHLLEEEV